MDVRAKKSLGQHFLVDLSAAQRIVNALGVDSTSAGVASAVKTNVLEIGPGMGVLTQYLLQRSDVNLKLVELDGESVEYLMSHFSGLSGKLYEADYLKLDIHKLFPGSYSVIGNFPYNISSQIFFKILDDRFRVPEVVCMVQKEVAERIAEGPGSKTYGILSVLLQAWYDIEYLFTVEPGAFAPPPKVRSAVIRLRRNSRTELCTGPVAEAISQKTGPSTNEKTEATGKEKMTEQAEGPQCQSNIAEKANGDACIIVDEKDFRRVVKTAFGQRRKTLRNALRPLLPEDFDLSLPILQKRAEQLSVSDFINLTAKLFYSTTKNPNNSGE